ncbi:hypothetical protein DK2_00008 [Bacillus phage DK2]|uniref:Uncharacterized protein n=1 Tax=Bacillus phage DK2 TaxID=2500809 RepID=A0A3T0IIY2_9CAUD|nr:hypothetical protein H3017_gp08 [Bacillus phage DK2]AZU99761.1 hypothetical protein DK2_00008 [Bacillus phage DK2]
MAIVTKTLTFEGKRAGSIVENPNIAYLNDVELTQIQYDQLYGSELRVTETDVLKFKFVIPNDAILGYSEGDIFYKSKMVSGENELRCKDKGVYNDDQTTYKQKLLTTYQVDLDNTNELNFNITTTGEYGIYEVKVDVIYNDNGLNSYGGQYQYDQGSGVIVTVPIQNKKLEEIVTELESKPTNSITNVTFAQIGVEIVD